MTEKISTWELRPRCLVVVPGLTFEEFAEGPWASIRGIHESQNFWVGDALVAAEVYGDRASQLFDENLTAARMGQLKWLAEAIPPARRRDDCSWTMHRLVAGLFNRRRGIFPAAYLDRKAELQDQLLARAAAEGWHSDSMATAIADLEKEALASITRRNEPPEDEQPTPEPASVADPAHASDDAMAIGASDGRSQGNGAGETEAGQTSGCGSAVHACPERDGEADEVPASDNPVSHGGGWWKPGAQPHVLRLEDVVFDPALMDGLAPAHDLSRSELATSEPPCVTHSDVMAGEITGYAISQGPIAPPDRAELRACIDAVRAAPVIPLADEARIAAALGRPGIDLGNTDRVLTAFAAGWRVKIEQQVDDGGKSRWSVMALKTGAQRAMGLNAMLPYALAETALAAMLSDMPPEPMPVREPVVAAIVLSPPKVEPIAVEVTHTPLLATYLAIPQDVRPKARKWIMHGSVHQEPAPAGEEIAALAALYQSASEDDRRPFRVVLMNEREAA